MRAICCCLSLSLLVSACASARSSAPLAGPLALNATTHKGQLLYMRYCNQCHPAGEAATGPALNNKSIPRPVMTLQVRQGVLGTMPKFPESEISEKDLEAIFDYVDALKAHAREV